MTDSDARIWRLEGIIQQMQADLVNIKNQIAQLQQQGFAAAAGGGGGSTSSGGVFTCVPSASVPAGGNLVLQTVYQQQAGVATALGTFTIFNAMGSDAVSGKVCMLMPDGAGYFYVISQSCA